MMKNQLDSTLKHVLENVSCGNNRTLKQPVKIRCNSMTGEAELKDIQNIS